MGALVSLVLMLLLAGAGRSSSTNFAVAMGPPETAMDYWQTVLPGTPMPPAIADLLTTEGVRKIGPNSEARKNSKNCHPCFEDLKKVSMSYGPEEMKENLKEVSISYGGEGEEDLKKAPVYFEETSATYRPQVEANIKEVSVSYGSEYEEDLKKVTVSYELEGNVDPKEMPVSYSPEGEEDLKEITMSYGLEGEDQLKKVSVSYALEREADLKKVSMSYVPEGEKDLKKVSVSYGLEGEENLKEVSVSYGSKQLQDDLKVSVSYGLEGGEDIKKVSVSYGLEGGEDLKKVSESYGPVGEKDLKKISMPYGLKHGEEDLKKVSMSYGLERESDLNKVSVSHGLKQGEDDLNNKVLYHGQEDTHKAPISFESQHFKNPKKVSIAYKPHTTDGEKELASFGNLLHKVAKRSAARKVTGEGRHHVHAHNHRDKTVADVFFFHDILRPGSVITPTIPPTISLPALLPRRVVDSIPFAIEQFADIVAMFAPASLLMAREIRWALNTCEHPRPLLGESAGCATSLESLAELPASLLGTRNLQAFSGNLPIEAAGTSALRGRYNVTAVRRLLESTELVTCHDLTYPYAVFYCHTANPTAAYMVTLASEDGAAPAMMEAMAVCHLDTSQWSPKNPFLEAHNLKPGDVAVCHFLSKLSIIWVRADKQGGEARAA